MAEKREIELSFGVFILMGILAANSFSQASSQKRIADALERISPTPEASAERDGL